MTDLHRRRVLALALAPVALGGLGALPAFAQDAEPEGQDTGTDRLTGDVVMGQESAPLTVIEYASLTCPHCADFHEGTFPQVKAEYIETGRVKFILREVYFDAPGLWASMIARCGGREAFYPIAGQLLAQQRQWTSAPEPAQAIMKIGRINGLSGQQMTECLSDRGFAETLVGNYRENAQADGVTSTPSFVIGGDLHSGNMGFEEFSALLERYLGS